MPEPKDVVRRFLEDGSDENGWNMDVILECFSENYFSHTWDGDRVRHTGEAFGLAATGKEVMVDHVEMWRVVDGKIAEHWGGIGAGGQLFRALTED